MLALDVVLLVSGCGSAGAAKQAEEVDSVAAEGALLAHDAAEGSTTTTFTRVHAKALRSSLRELAPAIEDARLSRDRRRRSPPSLDELADDPATGSARTARAAARARREGGGGAGG